MVAFLRQTGLSLTLASLCPICRQTIRYQTSRRRPAPTQLMLPLGPMTKQLRPSMLRCSLRSVQRRRRSQSSCAVLVPVRR